MDRITRLPSVGAGDQLDRALLEIDLAIALVLASVAVTITLSCLDEAEVAPSRVLSGRSRPGSRSDCCANRPDRSAW
jgi:hypothetical protein